MSTYIDNIIHKRDKRLWLPQSNSSCYIVSRKNSSPHSAHVRTYHILQAYSTTNIFHITHLDWFLYQFQPLSSRYTLQRLARIAMAGSARNQWSLPITLLQGHQNDHCTTEINSSNMHQNFLLSTSLFLFYTNSQPFATQQRTEWRRPTLLFVTSGSPGDFLHFPCLASHEEHLCNYFFFCARFPSPFFGFTLPLSARNLLISSAKSICSSLQYQRCSQHYVFNIKYGSLHVSFTRQNTRMTSFHRILW